MAGSSLGEVVSQLRVEKRWSQEQLAERANLHPATVKELERSPAANPRLATLRAIASALEVDICALVGSESTEKSEITFKEAEDSSRMAVEHEPLDMIDLIGELWQAVVVQFPRLSDDERDRAYLLLRSVFELAESYRQTALHDVGPIRPLSHAGSATRSSTADDTPIQTSSNETVYTLHLKATLLRKLGRRSEAVELLRRASATSGGDFEDYHNCALEAESLNELELARRLYERARDLNRDDLRVWRSYADCLSKRAEWRKEAEAEFQRLLESYPKDPSTVSYYLDHLIRSGKIGDAQKQLAQLQTLSKRSLDAARLYLIDLVQSHDKLGLDGTSYQRRLQSLATTLDRLVELYPAEKRELARLYAWLASAQTEFNSEHSLANFQKALDLGLDDARGLSMLAAQLEKRGATSLALKIWTLALEQRPTDEQLWQSLFSRVANSSRVPHQLSEVLLQLMETPAGADRLELLKRAMGPLEVPGDDAEPLLKEAQRVLQVKPRIDEGTSGPKAQEPLDIQSIDHWKRTG